MMIPAIGITTESEMLRIMLKMLLFHPCGVCPT